jgi:hypothetical protein
MVLIANQENEALMRKLRARIEELEEEQVFLKSELAEGVPVESFHGIHLTRQEAIIVSMLEGGKMIRCSAL